MELTIQAPSALVVDDEPAVARCLSKLLKRQGYDCTLMNDPIEALGRIRERSFDLVVSDLQMPKKNGIDFLREVISIRPESAAVLMTGFGDAQTQERAKELGADAYMTKSADEAEIHRCLSAAVMNKALRLATG